jgi:hypothetical protein
MRQAHFRPWQAKVLSFHTSKRLSEALRNDKCCICGSPAYLLVLSDCSRLCINHEFQNNDYLRVNSMVSAFAGFTEEDFRTLPVLTIPDQHLTKRIVRMVFVKHLKELLVSIYGEVAVDQLIINSGKWPQEITTPLKLYNLREKKPEFGISKPNRGTAEYKAAKHQLLWTTVPFPLISNELPTFGACCVECYYQYHSRDDDDENLELGLL